MPVTCVSDYGAGSDGKEVTFRNAEVIERITRNVEQGERQFDPMQQLLELDSLPVEVQEFVVHDGSEEQDSSLCLNRYP